MCISIFTRLYILKDITGVKIIGYSRTVLLPVLSVSVLSVGICYIIWKQLPSTVLCDTLFVLTSIIVCLMAIACIGITSNERQMLKFGANLIARKVK